MGRAVKLKRQRRELRRELERQLHDPRRHREEEACGGARMIWLEGGVTCPGSWWKALCRSVFLWR